LHYAKGAVLQVQQDGSSTYDVSGIGQVPHLDIVGTADSASGAVALFILNRDLEKSRQFEINWEGNIPGAVQQALVLTGDDLKAVNGFDAPERVKPKAADKPSSSGGKTRIEVPAKSYSVIQWGGPR
jgi:alpha-N-arabinofuranosidase